MEEDQSLMWFFNQSPGNISQLSSRSIDHDTASLEQGFVFTGMESEKVSSDLPYEYQLEDMSCFAEVVQETPPISSVKVELSKTWQNTSENSSDTTEQKEPETIGDENSSDKYECNFTECGKVFYNATAFRKHVRIHGPRLNTCAECGKSFVESSKLRRHFLVHSGEKPFRCTFQNCGKCFSLMCNLQSHMRLHMNAFDFQCQLCSKKFIQAGNLKTHIKRNHK